MADESAWKTGVICRCGGNIVAFTTVVKKNYIAHGFMCNGCKRTGKWQDLARGYFEWRRQQDKAL